MKKKTMDSVMSKMMLPKKATGKENKGHGVKLYPSDMKKIVTGGLMALLGYSAYSTVMLMLKRNTNPESAFVDPVESMNQDPTIRDAFINLQSYRSLNPWLFKMALQNVDQLLFLEHALLSGAAKAVRQDKAISWSYFRVALNRLGQFQFLIRKRMGSDHAMAAYMCVDKIYEQMRKHLLNILQLCSEFNPKDMIEKAPAEIERILKQLKEGREPMPGESMARWEKVREKLDRQARSVSESESETVASSRRSSRRSRRSRHS